MAEKESLRKEVMGSFGGFYKGEKRKLSKEELAKKAQKSQQQPYVFNLPELVRKKKEK